MSSAPGPTEQAALAKLLHRPGRHRTFCPKCDRGPRDKALSVLIEPEGGAVWLCHRCGWRGGIVGGERRDRWSARRPARRSRLWRAAAERPSLSPVARNAWGDCLPITPGTVAAVYLDSRRCALPPEDGHLRWHPEVEHHPGHVAPALIALVTDIQTCEPITIHMTWLEPDGSAKAAVDKPRLLLHGHRKAGGVIRLWPGDEVTMGLVLGEGIETCLAAAAAGLTPVWSTIDAGGLAHFPALPGLEGITILVDHDAAGIKAASALIGRYEASGFDPERDIKVIFPPAEGCDFNDLVMP